LSCPAGQNVSIGSGSCFTSPPTAAPTRAISPWSQLIVNGDFEVNPVPAVPACSVYQYQLPSGWQLLAGHRTFLVSSNCQFWGGTGVAAPSGKKYLAVQSRGGSSSLKQIVSVPPGLVGLSLTLRFYMSKRIDTLPSSLVAVIVNSVVLRTIALTNGFTRYTINTPAATSTMTVQFNDVSPVTSDYSYLVDNVTLSLAMPTSKF
jgi:hypothetical protein